MEENTKFSTKYIEKLNIQPNNQALNLLKAI